ncbi:hypothetical protein EYC84_001112 [Monilinia fructicola]|uniref:Uncharacterized protein n=1 Tax=Monilinia fructicola TaxID=38448 RepID=A0A5M9JJ52_MONFR|nr:hypothetical protein EYC84_001112 [Monilinia fructicola]
MNVIPLLVTEASLGVCSCIGYSYYAFSHSLIAISIPFHSVPFHSIATREDRNCFNSQTPPCRDIITNPESQQKHRPMRKTHLLDRCHRMIVVSSSVPSHVIRSLFLLI